MRRTILRVSVVIISLLVIASASIAAKEKVTAKLEAVKTLYDFGTAREGTNVPVTFMIKNTGTEEVKIGKITQAAGCVAPGPPVKNTLAPGDSVKLDYIFESLGYGNVTVKKWIKIYYNNPKLSPLELTVTGKVVPVEPYQAPIGELMYNFSVLVDIESPNDFSKEHIIGAINVPYEQLDKWAVNISKDVKEKTIIYLCSKDGIQSDKAAQILREKGFSHCLSLVGGLTEWKQQYGEGLLIRGKW